MVFDYGSVVLIIFLIPASKADRTDQEHLLGHFEKFIEDHGKVYESEEEKLSRFEIFKANLKEIERMNEEANGLTEFGVTKFADLTREEFRSRHLTSRHTGKMMTGGSNRIFSSPLDHSDLNNGDDLYNNLEDQMSEEGPYTKTTPKPPTPTPPTGPGGPMVAIDWRTKGPNPPIYNTLKCGSCWAFSALEVVEILLSVRDKKLIQLSKQQLVDCSKPENLGCSGGWPNKALQYIQKTGVVLESAYPYKGTDGTCHLPKPMGTAYKIKGFTSLKGEKGFLDGLATSPILIMIDGQSFQHYKSGILTTPCTGKGSLPYTAVIVAHGFEKAAGTKPAQTFWVLRISDGTGVYDKGFVKAASFIGLCDLGTEGYKVTI